MPSLRLEDELALLGRICLNGTATVPGIDTLGSHPERYDLYHRMVSKRLNRTMETALPRTRSAVPAHLWQKAFERWLTTPSPRTPHVRDVVPPFTRVLLETVSPHACDLARFESACWQARHDPRNEPPYRTLTFHESLVLNDTLQLLSLDHPVHHRDERAKARRRTFLCVYRRNDDFKEAVLSVNEIAHALISRWQSYPMETVTEAVQRVREERGTTLDETFLEGLAELMARLVHEQVILGSRA